MKSIGQRWKRHMRFVHKIEARANTPITKRLDVIADLESISAKVAADKVVIIGSDEPGLGDFKGPVGPVSEPMNERRGLGLVPLSFPDERMMLSGKSEPDTGPWLGGSEIVKELGRCSGHCCRSFNMPLKPDDVAAMADAINAGIRPGTLEWRHPQYANIDIIAPMLVYQDDVMRTPAGDRFRDVPGEQSHWYTCKHHCKVSGNCTIYEKRPAMCRDHPYGRTCNYEDCTMKTEREWYTYVGPPNVQVQAEVHKPSLLETWVASKRSKPMREPRYDEVYADGVAWLDGMDDVAEYRKGGGDDEA